MNIAVNAKPLTDNNPGEYGNFIYEVFRRIVQDHPQHQFIFIYDRKPVKEYVFGPSAGMVVAGPKTRNPLLWKFWYDIKIPAVLKKIKADVFVSCDGTCSLGTPLPQCMLVHDLAFLHDPLLVTRSYLYYYKRYTAKFLAKTKGIATVSEFSRNDIATRYSIPASSIDVVYSGVKDIFRPLDEAKRAAIKNKYTNGREYFIYTGSVDPRKNLFNLLKAFSVFKKRQQTGMKLVIAGKFDAKPGTLKESISTYKYRDDVVLTGELPVEELAGLTASAWAMVYPSLFEGFGEPVVEAMRSGVPVITTIDSAMQEISRGAAIYTEVKDHIALSDKMMLLYKDEDLRRSLIQKGLEVAKEYSWERTAQLLWASIQKAVGEQV